MCLTKVYQKKYKKSEVPITCYKIARRFHRGGEVKYFSTIRGFQYKLGKKYTENSMHLRELNRLDYLEAGVFHSYSQIIMYDLSFIRWSNGQNAIMDFDWEYVILECVIPPGTPYWVGRGHVFASRSIKVIKDIDPKDFPDELTIGL